MKFPYKVEPNPEFEKKWARFQSLRVITDSKAITATKAYLRIAENIYNFEVRPDDVWVLSYPRSGTTLTQEMVWMIINDNYDTAKNVPLVKRFPYLEIYSHYSAEHIEEVKSQIKDEQRLKEFTEIMSPQWITLRDNPNRRFIKSHLQFPLLPPKLLTSGCKIVYVARNPKDVALSLFKFVCPNAPTEDFPEFFDLFRGGYIEIGPYWSHVMGGWEQRGNPNFCFMFYEDILKDMRSAIKKVASFMEKDMTNEQLDKLEDHLNIENFRNNKSVNRMYGYFMRNYDDKGSTPIRKGIVGDWKDYFTDDMNTKANTWIEENYKKTDLRFPVDFK